MMFGRRIGWRGRVALICAVALGASAIAGAQVRYEQLRTPNGVLEGVVSADGKVRTFKGIPYAAPPVGELRWKPPQPAPEWAGVRKAADYPARCMQGRIYPDMVFNDKGPSEDCLYLNLWMPAAPEKTPLPVMVWIYGGGFAAGATSEPRQDAGNLSKKGVLVVTMNYRLGVFGFFSHPELTKESGRKASGNYGLLDQLAALKWVKKNIATFGGDPNNVTIFGESAGSFSVSALMGSPLAQGLFKRAIGESGAFFGTTLPLRPLAETEKADVEFAKSSLGTTSLQALRAKPAEEILQASLKQETLRFSPNVDGYFLPKDISTIYASGKQSHVPLLAGWNADENSYRSIFGLASPTAQNFATRVRALYGDQADAVLKLYAATTDAEAKRAAQDLAGDRFIAYGTWKWMEMQLKTGKSPVFRYRFDQTLPLTAAAAQNPNAEPTAPHSSEIEYVFQVLSSKRLPWRPEDRKVSDLMGSYWTNFAKTGNPNGPDLPQWPVYGSRDGYQVMHLTADPRPAPDRQRARYELLDNLKPGR
jgi:para-nitrobenzyl esterase